MRLTSLFEALSDDNRLRLLSLIKDKEVCVCHLQKILGTNQPRISRHLAYLKKRGLVEARRQGNWIHYRLKQCQPESIEVLAVSLHAISNEPVIKKDKEKLKKISCKQQKRGRKMH